MAAEATYKSQDINHKIPNLMEGGYWGEIRFDADDTLPDYIGLNKLNGASTADETWKIYGFTYVGGAATRIRLAYGAWDDRVALFP